MEHSSGLKAPPNYQDRHSGVPKCEVEFWEAEWLNSGGQIRRLAVLASPSTPAPQMDRVGRLVAHTLCTLGE